LVWKEETVTSEELRIIAEVHDQWAFEMDEQVPPDPAGALVAERQTGSLAFRGRPGTRPP
jgi:hypothetical protein